MGECPETWLYMLRVNVSHIGHIDISVRSDRSGRSEISDRSEIPDTSIRLVR